MKYFTIDELCRSDKARQMGINNTPTDDIIDSLSDLVENVLDPAREKFGLPITVNSGYRCPELNKAVGGMAASQHTKGEAADITTGSRGGNKRLYEIIRDSLQFDQLIDEYDYKWIHVSYRNTVNRKQILKIG
nr:MAG TPA: peptidase [Caudoviricetes sp.]